MHGNVVVRQRWITLGVHTHLILIFGEVVSADRIIRKRIAVVPGLGTVNFVICGFLLRLRVHYYRMTV
jgi:hypothetical protein